MEYTLINNNDEIVQQHWFDDEPPTLAPEKGLVWMQLILDYDICTEDQEPGEPEIIVDRVTGTVTKHFPAIMKPVPTTVSMRQARLQLLATDNLATVDAAVSGMGASAQIEWEYATEVQRSNPLVAGIQALLQWTDEQLDTYFIKASKL